MSKSQDLIQSKVVSYLKSAWYARWGVVVIVGASFWFVPQVNRAVIESLMVLAIVYNFLLLFSGRRIALLNNRSLILVIDGAMALLLVIYTGGSTSPYLLTLAFMIISGAYWYGAWIGISIGVIQFTTLSIQYRLEHQAPTVPRNLIVHMLILMTIGVYISLLTRPDRLERQDLIKLSTETEKERQRLLTLINSMRDAVLVVDNSDNIVMYNQAASNLVNTHQQLQGQSIQTALRFEDADKKQVKLKIGHAADAFERKDLRLRAPDNSLIDVSINVAPYIVDRQNRGHVLIVRDITQDKTIDTEREEFVAVASHELRTPLTIAQGDVSMLLSPPYLPQNPESVEMLNGAMRSLQQLSNIIKDLTNLSEVESDKLGVQLESLNPIALLHDFQSDYDDQAKSKGLELRVKIDPDLRSMTVLTSRYVVREILSIFVANAIKFTDKGSITLTVMNPDDKAPGVTFAVGDTGLGIAQSDQRKIFEKFFQSEQYATRVHGGTGLGLYIAKRLASRITARLWFESELGKGSTFYIWVPPYSQSERDNSQVAAAEAKDFFSNV